MADTTNVKITVKSAHKILRSRNLKSTPNFMRECYHFYDIPFGYNPLMTKYCGKTWEGIRIIYEDGTIEFGIDADERAGRWTFAPQWIDKVEQLNEGGT